MTSQPYNNKRKARPKRWSTQTWLCMALNAPSWFGRRLAAVLQHTLKRGTARISAVSTPIGTSINVLMRRVFFCLGVFGVTSAQADTADAAITAFSQHCFSPYLTAKTAETALSIPGARYDFYDLRPFSVAAVSPVTRRAATPGTDRRCEVAFDGAHTAAAIISVTDALEREGILTAVDLPEGFEETPGTALLAARQLNPRRVAVVHVGTRDGPNGTETFLSVERLHPRNLEASE